MEITRKSQISGITRTLDIPCTEDQLKAWRNGAHIQVVMAHLSPSQREFIISGATDEEWDDLFPEEEEEESNFHPFNP